MEETETGNHASEHKGEKKILIKNIEEEASMAAAHSSTAAAAAATAKPSNNKKERKNRHYKDNLTNVPDQVRSKTRLALACMACLLGLHGRYA